MQGGRLKNLLSFSMGILGLGSRRADPTYDLFAVAMIMINAVYPKRFNKDGQGLTQLTSMIKQNKLLEKFEEVILSALKGNYQTAAQMRRDLIAAVNKEKSYNTYGRSQGKNSISPKRQQSKGRKGGFVETCTIFLIVVSFYVIYMFGQLI